MKQDIKATHIRSGGRNTAFILGATAHGPLIFSRHDWQRVSDLPGGRMEASGVGCQLMEHGAYETEEVQMLVGLAELRRRHHGDGVVVIDGGANVGVHTVELAKHMGEWGVVMAVEAQERVFYALAGNLALNNCFNAKAMHAAVGETDGMMMMPLPNYCAPGQLGGLNLRNEADIGQPIELMTPVRVMTIDSLQLERLDLLKLDIEGMEHEALTGAAATIERCKPVLWVEHIKSDKVPLQAFMTGLGYEMFDFLGSICGVHYYDKVLDHVRNFAQEAERVPVEAA